MLTRRKILAAAALSSLAPGLSPKRAFAQPTEKLARVVVGFPAGGSTDVIARLIAEKLTGYASNVVIENRAGAGSRLAVEYVKSADPDGNTILFTPDFPLTLYPHLFKSLNYAPLSDFAAVAPVSRSSLVLSIGPLVPNNVTTMAEFLDWCRANPTKASYATSGAGGVPHLTGIMVSNAAKVDIHPVHYKGGAPALTDLVGGHIAASINPIDNALAYIKAGSIRPLAITGARRSHFAAKVPTMKEAGFEIVIEPWLGFFVPARTPPDRVKVLSKAIYSATHSPEVIEKLNSMGVETFNQDTEEFKNTLRTDTEGWRQLVKISRISAE